MVFEPLLARIWRLL